MIQIPLLQIVTDTVASAVSQPSEAVAETLSVFDLAVKGGWIMLVLLLLSLLAGYLFVTKLMQIRQANKSEESFMERIQDYLKMDRVDSALALCRNKNSAESRMIEKGLSRLHRSTTDISRSIENAGNVEVGKLEKGMPLLATIAAAAPMIGFLGTVTGMIRAFFDLSHSSSGIDVSLLSFGIYQALVTTVGGLIVGIVVLFAYNYLISLIDNTVNKLENRTIEFMDMINEE